MRSQLLASAATRFAHLLGTAAAPAASSVRAEKTDEERAEEEERKKRDDETDAEYKDRMKKLDDKKEKDKDAETTETDEDDDDTEKEKAAARVEGITAERKRWGDVFASQEVTGRVALACTLLAETETPADGVIAILKSAPVEAKTKGLQQRMSAEPTPAPGPSGGDQTRADTPQALATTAIEAARKARGETKAA